MSVGTFNSAMADINAAARWDKLKREAADKFSAGRIRLVVGGAESAKAAFFATVLMRLEVRVSQPGEGIDTMATDGKSIWYSPEFTCKLDREELLGVLAHESLHVTNAHPARCGDRNPKLWNIACVLPGTKISMADGSEKNIEDIQAGDWILGVENGQVTRGRVVHQFSKMTDNLVSVRADGAAVTTSGEHRFLTKDGYVESRKLCSMSDRKRQVFRLRTQVRGRKLSGPVDSRNGVRDGAKFRERGGVSGHARTIQDTKNRQATNHIATVGDSRHGNGLSGRDHRRGGNNQHRRENHPIRSNAPSAVCFYSQHIAAPSRLVRIARNAGVLDYEQTVSTVFQDYGKRLGANRSSEKTSTPIDNQTATVRLPDRDLHNSVEFDPSHTTQPENIGIDSGDPKIELAAATADTIEVRGQTRVYDLVTTCHSYFANGFAVHNCDLAINCILADCGFKLPKGCCMPAKGPFKDLAPGLAAEEYYALLQQEIAKHGAGIGDGADPGGCGGVKQPGDNGPAARAASEADAKLVAAQAQQAAETVSRSGRGKSDMPGSLIRSVEQVLEARVDWHAELAAFVDRQAKNDYSFARPNRRYIASGLYLPGYCGEDLGNVVAMVDLSGSITAQVVDEFAAELQGVLDSYNCTLTIIYHDDAVQGVEEWKSTDGPLVLCAGGGGGTSHIPAFEEIEKRDIQPTCVIALTDLYTDFPDNAPYYPVLWAVAGNKGALAPWGRTIHIPKPLGAR